LLFGGQFLLLSSGSQLGLANAGGMLTISVAVIADANVNIIKV
jgi:hypothetical protein